MARKSSRARKDRGEDPAQAQENVGEDNRDYTREGDEREAPAGGPSGHRAGPRYTNAEAKRRAQYCARMEVGDGNEWEQFYPEEEADVNFESLEARLLQEGWKFVRSYPYVSPEGIVLYKSRRYNFARLPNVKRFLLRHRVGEVWETGAGPVRVPYNLEQICARPDDITLVEGEKAVEYLKKKGLLATCVQGQNWTSAMMEFFVGRTVNVAMDNDDAGYENIETAREWLGKVNATLRVIDLPDSPPAAGLDDWIEQHSVEEYRALVAKTKPEGMSTPTAYTFPPEETIAVYDWLYGRHLLRGEVCGSAAMGGTGKSNLSLIEAISMAIGKQLLHDSVAMLPMRVVLINLEDNRNTMDKRIAAIMRHYKLTKADVGDRLIIIAKGEIKITVATQKRGGEVERNEKCINALTALMLRHRAAVLSIDSFIRTHGVSENENKAIQAVISCFEDIAGAANCGVHLWHHTRKLGGEKASVEAARGAQSFIDACRSVRILETMTKKERDDLLGVMPDIAEAGYYFRAFNGKRNFAPPADQSDWFKYVSVKLNNSPCFEIEGDNVGVVTRWEYPKIELPKVHDVEIKNALTAVRGGGPWRADPRSAKEPWVGIPIAQALRLNLLDTRVKKSVVKLVKDWLAAGLLIVVEGQDETRRTREYVEAAPEK